MHYLLESCFSSEIIISENGMQGRGSHYPLWLYIKNNYSGKIRVTKMNVGMH